MTMVQRLELTLPIAVTDILGKLTAGQQAAVLGKLSHTSWDICKFLIEWHIIHPSNTMFGYLCLSS